MDNCTTCRWRRDLIELRRINGTTTKTYKEGFVCIGCSMEEAIWITDLSDYKMNCPLHTPREE